MNLFRKFEFMCNVIIVATNVESGIHNAYFMPLDNVTTNFFDTMSDDLFNMAVDVAEVECTDHDIEIYNLAFNAEQGDDI